MKDDVFDTKRTAQNTESNYKVDNSIAITWRTATDPSAKAANTFPSGIWAMSTTDSFSCTHHTSALFLNKRGNQLKETPYLRQEKIT